MPKNILFQGYFYQLKNQEKKDALRIYERFKINVPRPFIPKLSF